MQTIIANVENTRKKKNVCKKFLALKLEYLLIMLHCLSESDRSVEINTLLTGAEKLKLEETMYDLICTVDHIGSAIES